MKPIFKTKLKTIFIFSLLVFIFIPEGFAQTNNPRKYFDYVNKAELAICDSNYVKAVKNYKKAFKYLKEPFGADLHNFLHCGVLTEDKECIAMCVPKYKERKYLFLPYLSIVTGEDTPIFKYGDSLYRSCTSVSKLDTNYINLISKLTRKDQEIRIGSPEITDEEMFLIDSANMAQFIHYMDSTGIFPTESVVGNKTNNPNSAIRYELLLLHQAYGGVAAGYKNPFNLHLDEKVLSGEFSPDLYAHLCDARGYGLDGKEIRQSSQSPVWYGCNFYIIGYQSNNPDFSFNDETTWKKELHLKKLSRAEEKAIDKRRRKMNMEPFQDLLKKVRFQMNTSGSAKDFAREFALVDHWLLGVELR